MKNNKGNLLRPRNIADWACVQVCCALADRLRLKLKLKLFHLQSLFSLLRNVYFWLYLMLLDYVAFIFQTTLLQGLWAIISRSSYVCTFLYFLHCV
jgi:hypothetical protein